MLCRRLPRRRGLLLWFCKPGPLTPSTSTAERRATYGVTARGRRPSDMHSRAVRLVMACVRRGARQRGARSVLRRSGRHARAVGLAMATTALQHHSLHAKEVVDTVTVYAEQCVLWALMAAALKASK